MVNDGIKMTEVRRKEFALIDTEWLNTLEGMSYVKQLHNHTTMKRKLFGILEHPSLIPGIQQVIFKIFLTGKSGVGKTTAVALLADQLDFSSTMYSSETLGIKATDVYWPAKLPDKIVVCKLQFWDAGESSSKKYSHIVPACQENLDCILATFSFNDKQSFLDATSEFESNKISKNPENSIMFLLGISWSETSEVREAEVRDFEKRHKTIVLRMKLELPAEKNRTREIYHILNVLCDILLIKTHV